jgi:hypothetical protein
MVVSPTGLVEAVGKIQSSSWGNDICNILLAFKKEYITVSAPFT